MNWREQGFETYGQAFDRIIMKVIKVTIVCVFCIAAIVATSPPRDLTPAPKTCITKACP